MSTIIDDIRKGKDPGFLEQIATEENMDRSSLIRGIISGSIVVPKNRNHENIHPIAIGKRTCVKVNANIGTSPERSDFNGEMSKVSAAIHAGADTIMDLSISGDIRGFRKRIIGEFQVPLGTVPLYEAMTDTDDPEKLSIEGFLETMEAQASDGVDFMTIHSGMLRRHLDAVDQRVLGIVSRGGAAIAHWMRCHGKENFLYTYFDRILEIAGTHDVTISLGDGLRPGCTNDANDAAQFGELTVIGELVERARKAGVQVMVEGPGHVPLHLVGENVARQKEICQGAPFYVLGPLVIDYAAGYDHIAGAIGGALAAFHGADFLCYLTPAEHLRLPTVEDVKEGVIASRIAAAAADLAKGRVGSIERNLAISSARMRFDWESQRNLAIDPEKFDRYLEREQSASVTNHSHAACSMCGKWCALKQGRTQ